jgi:hypothetical protein
VLEAQRGARSSRPFARGFFFRVSLPDSAYSTDSAEIVKLASNSQEYQRVSGASGHRTHGWRRLVTTIPPTSHSSCASSGLAQNLQILLAFFIFRILRRDQCCSSFFYLVQVVYVL